MAIKFTEGAGGNTSRRQASEADLDQGHLPSVKTLGILWVAEEDMFTYKAHPPGKEFQLTKRSFLKSIATLFDPLGFLAPYIVRAKIILQLDCGPLG